MIYILKQKPNAQIFTELAFVKKSNVTRLRGVLKFLGDKFT